MNDVGLYLIDTRVSGNDTVEYWVKKGKDDWPGASDVDAWPC
jgi:hypothetical protein